MKNEDLKKGISKRWSSIFRNKAIMILLALIVISGAVFGGNKLIDAFGSKFSENMEKSDELFPSNEIPVEYEDNLYVELNNKLVKAMNDFEEGIITEEEYKKICQEVYEKIDTDEEYGNLAEAEEEFQEEVREGDTNDKNN